MKEWQNFRCTFLDVPFTTNVKLTENQRFLLLEVVVNMPFTISKILRLLVSSCKSLTQAYGRAKSGKCWTTSWSEGIWKLTFNSVLVQPWLEDYNGLKRGSGCGSVGRVVTSDSTGPRFESSHRQKIIYILNYCLLSTVYWKEKNKEKRGRE